jgi:beta-galactosidase beta subunit
MVFDSIDHADRYFALGKGIETALRYFKAYDVAAHETGRLIRMDKHFRQRLSYQTAQSDKALAEAHREYVDVMFVLSAKSVFTPSPAYLKTYERVRRFVDACLGAIDADAASFRFPAGYFFSSFSRRNAHCGDIFGSPSM